MEEPSLHLTLLDDSIAAAESTGSQVDSSDLRSWWRSPPSSRPQRNASNSWLSHRERHRVAFPRGGGVNNERSTSPSEMKELLKSWTEPQTFVEQTRQTEKKPAVAFSCLKTVSCPSDYRTVLKTRQKQTALDQFLVLRRLRPSELEAGPSGRQTPKDRKDAGEPIPDALLPNSKHLHSSSPAAKDVTLRTVGNCCF